MSPSMSKAKRRPNDIGGKPAGRVTPSSHDAEPWERLINGMVSLCGPTSLKLMYVDEFRRVREEFDEDYFNTLGYFELWTQTFINLLEEKGVLSRAEVERRASDIKKRLGGAS